MIFILYNGLTKKELLNNKSSSFLVNMCMRKNFYYLVLSMSLFCNPNFFMFNFSIPFEVIIRDI